MYQRSFIFSALYFVLILLLSHANAATPQYDFSFEEPLVIAADRGNIHEITRLLKNGAKVNKQDKFGVTPLMRAVFRGNSEAVKVLLDAGADVHIRDIGGATALHLAARLGHNTISDMLLKNGANPNALDIQGYTPLERAIKNEREGVVRALVNEGANLTLKGQGNLTPSELAFQGNNKKIQQIFNEAKPIVMIESPKVANDVHKNDGKEQAGERANNIPDILTTKENASGNVAEEEAVVTDITKTNNLLPEQKPALREEEAESAPVDDTIKNKKSKQSSEEANIPGILATKENASDKTAEKETIVINTDEASNNPLVFEEKAALHEEPVVSKVEQDLDNDASLTGPISKNEQSFDILALFQNLEHPSTGNQYGDIEKEVTFAIAEDDQFIGPELAAGSEPGIVPEEDVIIIQSIPAPEIVRTSPPKQENAMTVAGNNEITTVRDLRESTAARSLKNKELLVQARKVPDSFPIGSTQSNMATTPAASYYIELGSFHSEAEAKKFINAKLPQHATQAEVNSAANNLYKVTMKGLDKTRADLLCSTLAPPSSAINCNILNQLAITPDTSFGLY